MEFEEPEQQRGPPPLPKIKARDSKGRSCLQADCRPWKNPEGRKRVCASPDAQREGRSRGAVGGSRLERRKPCSASQVETRG